MASAKLDLIFRNKLTEKENLTHFRADSPYPATPPTTTAI